MAETYAMEKTRRVFLTTCAALPGITGCLSSDSKSEDHIPQVNTIRVKNFHYSQHTISVCILGRNSEKKYEESIQVKGGKPTDPSEVFLQRQSFHPDGSIIQSGHKEQSRSDFVEYDFSKYTDCVNLIIHIGDYNSPNKSLSIFSGRCRKTDN
jgi:hypothetical protein